ncbi:MAG: Glutathione transferase [Chloroflexi bacterium]|nr:Glutathione transferase [Chloroflexota bacterium]
MSETGTPDLANVNRFTIPVRKLDKAETFYTQVLGAEVIDRAAVEVGMHGQKAIRVQLCEGIELSLVQQNHGFIPIDGSHPHYAFTVSGADVESWMDHFDEWGVPYALVCRDFPRAENGAPVRIEMYFFDPDGNHLEIDARGYPMSDKVWMGTYNHWSQFYQHDEWPPGVEQAHQQAK